MFKLHSQLNADTITLGSLKLSQVLLMNNASLPWVILVPRKENVSEWHALSKEDQLQLHHESMLISELLMQEFKGDKMNIGALGNLVPQLHVHHIVRYKNDPAWPQPVWGNLQSNSYSKYALAQRSQRIQQLLSSQTNSNFKIS